MELSEWHRWWKRQGGAGVRRFLLHDWDPIGVAEMPDASDEYDAYVGVVGRMLHESRSAEEIAAYLADVRVGHMGLTPIAGDEDKERRIASELVAWYSEEMRS